MAFETEYGYFSSVPGSGILDIYPNLFGKEVNIPICNLVNSGKKSVCGVQEDINTSIIEKINLL
jgi:hypothetical protein